MCCALGIGGGVLALSQTRHNRRPSAPAVPAKPAHVKIDLDKSLAVALPTARAELTPASFKTPDGRAGWVVRIPGGLPIATPAYARGKVYIGGGYGSHEFYAFNSDTGEKVWQIKTSDDGPSAAVVEDGCVAFNTESCTVIVADAETGHILWQKWLGDPLMSQPAISKGRLYMAYPAGGRGQGGINAAPNQMANSAALQKSDQPPHLPAAAHPAGGQQPAPAHQAASGAGQAPGSGTAKPAQGGYRLLCADLRTGHPIWTQTISADVISAPVVEGDRVFLTCFDGTSYGINAITGAVIWTKHNSGTSAPVVANGQVMMTLKQQQGGKDYEGIQRYSAAKGGATDSKPLAVAQADYFKNGNGVTLKAEHQAALDSSVGFGGGAPAGAGMAANKANVGVGTVAGGWAFQGSRAAYHRGLIMNAQGDALNSLSEKDGRTLWKAKVQGARVDAGQQVFSPPALGAKNMYLCTTQGHLLSVDQKTGAVQFQYATKQPMAFQPALANGSVYAGTANGMLVCLKTGSKDADGWTAWGGNAQHNKKD